MASLLCLTQYICSVKIHVFICDILLFHVIKFHFYVLKKKSRKIKYVVYRKQTKITDLHRDITSKSLRNQLKNV